VKCTPFDNPIISLSGKYDLSKISQGVAPKKRAKHKRAIESERVVGF